jgi:hypothetical protein
MRKKNTKDRKTTTNLDIHTPVSAAAAAVEGLNSESRSSSQSDFSIS